MKGHFFNSCFFLLLLQLEKKTDSSIHERLKLEGILWLLKK